MDHCPGDDTDEARGYHIHHFHLQFFLDLLLILVHLFLPVEDILSLLCYKNIVKVEELIFIGGESWFRKDSNLQGNAKVSFSPT